VTSTEAFAWVVGACAAAAAAGGFAWRVVVAIRATRAAWAKKQADLREEGRQAALHEAAEARAKEESRANLALLKTMAERNEAAMGEQSKDIAVIKAQVLSHDTRITRMETKS
jgi:hypothetical protein